MEIQNLYMFVPNRCGRAHEQIKMPSCVGIGWARRWGATKCVLCITKEAHAATYAKYLLLINNKAQLNWRSLTLIQRVRYARFNVLFSTQYHILTHPQTWITKCTLSLLLNFAFLLFTSLHFFLHFCSISDSVQQSLKTLLFIRNIMIFKAKKLTKMCIIFTNLLFSFFYLSLSFNAVCLFRCRRRPSLFLLSSLIRCLAHFVA